MIGISVFTFMQPWRVPLPVSYSEIQTQSVTMARWPQQRVVGVSVTSRSTSRHTLHQARSGFFFKFKMAQRALSELAATRHTYV